MFNQGDFVYVSGEGDEIYKIIGITDSYATVSPDGSSGGWREPIHKLTKITGKVVETQTTSYHLVR